MSVSRVDVVNVVGNTVEEVHREYTITYRVITTTRADGPYVVLSAGNLPRRGDFYQYGNDLDIFATCKSIGPARLERAEDTGKAWLVDAVFSTKGSQRDPADNPGDPISWAWKVSGSFGSGQWYPRKDANGRAIANTADEPFEDVPPIDDPRMIISLEKNTASLNIDTWKKTRGKVNSSPLWGLPVRQVKLLQWSWNVQFTGQGAAYISNKFEVEINDEGYYYSPLDQGFREKLGKKPDGKPNYWTVLLNGELPTRPVRLDGNGQVLLEGQASVYFDAAAGLTKRYELEGEYDFTTIFPSVLPGPIT